MNRPKWKIQHCQKPGCNRPTVWAQTPSIHRVQVDAYPSTEGTYYLENTGHRDPVAYSVAAADQLGRNDLYRAHYMTCDGSAVRRWERS